MFRISSFCFIIFFLILFTLNPNLFKSKVERGMKGQEFVNEVVMEWESAVNRVAKCELGEKMIVCGRAARWWDEQIKDKINARCEVGMRRLLMILKICGMSIVDYWKK